MDLDDRMADWGRRLAERESSHVVALDQARAQAAALYRRVIKATDRFHESCREAGAGHLRIDVSEPRADDKHIHSIQFDLMRGRQCAIVTVKSRGEVTLVGPFRLGKTEGPCRSFPVESEEIEAGLAELFENFIEEAFRE